MDEFPSSTRLDIGKFEYQTATEVTIKLKKHKALDKKER